MFGTAIKEDVARCVNEAIFSLLVDETKDASKKEELAIFFRYFDVTEYL